MYGAAELVHGYLRARRKQRLIVPVRLPGKAARAFRAGANLSPGRAVGRRTWEEFLADRLSSPSDTRSSLPGGADSRLDAEADTSAAS